MKTVTRVTVALVVSATALVGAGNATAYIRSTFLSQQNAATIYQFDSYTGSTVQTYTNQFGGRSNYSTASPDGELVFVPGLISKVLHVIRSDDNALVANLPLPGYGGGVDVGPDPRDPDNADKLVGYVVTGTASKVTRFSIDKSAPGLVSITNERQLSDSEDDDLGFISESSDITLSADGKRVFVAETGGTTPGSKVAVLNNPQDPSELQVLKEFTTGVKPRALAAVPDPDGSGPKTASIVVGNQGLSGDTTRKIRIFPDLESCNTPADSQAGNCNFDALDATDFDISWIPYSLVTSPDGKKVYGVCKSGNCDVLSRIDNFDLTPQIAEYKNSGVGGVDLKITADGTRAFVVTGGSSSKGALRTVKLDDPTPTRISEIDAIESTGLNTVTVADPDGDGSLLERAYAGTYLSPGSDSNYISGLYVAENEIDPAQIKWTDSFGLGNRRDALVASSDGKHVYVYDRTHGDLLDMSPKAPFTLGVASGTNGVIRNLGFGCTDPAITADDRYIYIPCEGQDEVVIVNTASLRVVKRVQLPSGADPKGVAILPNGLRAYVAESGRDKVAVIENLSDLENGNTLMKKSDGSTLEIDSGDDPRAVVTSADGRWVYVADFGSNQVTRIVDTSDPDSFGFQNASLDGNGPTSLTIVPKPSGDELWVANGDGTISIVDAINLTKAHSPVTGLTSPTGISTLPKADRVLVADTGKAEIYSVDPLTYTLSTAASFSAGPFKLEPVPNRAPTAAFAAPNPVHGGDSASLNASNSSDSDSRDYTLDTGIGQYSWDFGDGSPPQSGDASTAKIVSHSFPVEPVEKTYTVKLSVVDREGNDGKARYNGQMFEQVGGSGASTSQDITVLDGVAPETVITDGIADQSLTNSTSATFNYEIRDEPDAGESIYQCSLNGSDFNDCGSGASGSVTYTADDGIEEGINSFEVRAVDDAGNTDSSAEKRTWTVDTTVPAVVITEMPPQQTSDDPQQLVGIIDTAGPSVTINRANKLFARKGVKRRSLKAIKGKASDSQSSVASVDVAIGLKVKKRIGGKFKKLCRFLSGRRLQRKATKCGALTFVRATGTTEWSLKLPRLPAGQYAMTVRAADSLGNLTLKKFKLKVRR